MLRYGEYFDIIVVKCDLSAPPGKVDKESMQEEEGGRLFLTLLKNCVKGHGAPKRGYFRTIKSLLVD